MDNDNSHSDSTLKALFLSLLHTRLIACALALGIIFSYMVGLLLLFLRIRDRISIEAITYDLLSGTRNPAPLYPLIQNVAAQLQKVLVSEYWSLGRLGVLFLTLIFLGSEIVKLILSFFIEGILLPRGKWTWSYLANRSDYEKKIFIPLMIIAFSTLIGAMIFTPLKHSIEINPLAPSIPFFVNIILLLAVIILTLDYVTQTKSGFLHYLSKFSPRFTEFIRVLLARFFRVVTIIMFFFLALIMIQRMAIPRMVEAIQKGSTKIYNLTSSLKMEVSSMDTVSTHQKDSINSNVQEVVKRFKGHYESFEKLPEYFNQFLDKLKPTLAIIIFLSFLTTLYFPLVYTKIKFMPLYTGIILVSLIGIDLGLRIVPDIFRLRKSGPTAIVIIIGLAMIFGELISQIARYAFRKQLKCCSCKATNPLGAKFCVKCACPLNNHSNRLTFIGNQKTRYIHLSTCPFVEGINKRVLIVFDEIKTAEQKGYSRCRLCLKEI